MLHVGVNGLRVFINLFLTKHFLDQEHVFICDFQVWVRKGDGSKTKLYIGQLQKGKYRIKKS